MKKTLLFVLGAAMLTPVIASAEQVTLNLCKRSGGLPAGYIVGETVGTAKVDITKKATDDGDTYTLPNFLGYTGADLTFIVDETATVELNDQTLIGIVMQETGNFSYDGLFKTKINFSNMPGYEGDDKFNDPIFRSISFKGEDEDTKLFVDLVYGLNDNTTPAATANSIKRSHAIKKEGGYIFYLQPSVLCQWVGSDDTAWALQTTGLDYYLVFSYPDGLVSGIDNVMVSEDSNAPVEYYNLQGVRVENPANGLYIRRQGEKVEKVAIR